MLTHLGAQTPDFGQSISQGRGGRVKISWTWLTRCFLIHAFISVYTRGSRNHFISSLLQASEWLKYGIILRSFQFTPEGREKIWIPKYSTVHDDWVISFFFFKFDGVLFRFFGNVFAIIRIGFRRFQYEKKKCRWICKNSVQEMPQPRVIPEKIGG